MQETLGHLVWPGWKPNKVSFLYKKGNFDYLLFHKNPPNEFQHLKKSAYGSPVYYMTRTDSLDLETVDSINNIVSEVLTSPNEDEDLVNWLLKSVHEMLHVYQSNKSIKGSLKSTFEEAKNYPIANFSVDFNNDLLLASIRLEADNIFSQIIVGAASKKERRVLIKKDDEIILELSNHK